MNTHAPLVDMMFFLVLFALMLYVFTDGDFESQKGQESIFSVTISAQNKSQKFVSLNPSKPKAKINFEMYSDGNGVVEPISKFVPNLQSEKSEYPKRVFAVQNKNIPKTVYFVVSKVNDPSVYLKPVSINIDLLLEGAQYACESAISFVPGRNTAVYFSVDSSEGKCTVL